MRRAPALIVGGGPAGAAAAIALARGGVRSTLLERQRETGDALCGGFLSWRSLDRLAALGVDADALNRHRIGRVRLFADRARAEAALPRPALAVSRRRLDALLLARAEAAGAGVERGVAVREIDGRAARTADGATVDADALLLASGKHDVRGRPRPAPRDADPALGLRIRLPAAPGLARLVGDAVELHLFAGGYAGLALQEDGSANLCLAVRRSRVQAAGGPRPFLAALGDTSPALGDRLAFEGGAEPLDAVANVPYGWRWRGGEAGLARLGDQAACIPSLAGEGMGIALASGASAAAALLDGGPAGLARWQRGFARRLARPMLVAGLARHVAESGHAAPLLPAARPALIRVMARLTRVAP
jgi:menaquinone-9 beta-reductase